MVDFKLNCKKIPDENQIEFNADNRESLVSLQFYVKLITLCSRAKMKVKYVSYAAKKLLKI